MQANYAGALGIAYINIFYAPYLVGMNEKQMHQVAQELIFNGSQNAFSRGGQTLFLDFNIHTGVPTYLKTVPAIGPGGCYMLRKADGKIIGMTSVLKEDYYPLPEIAIKAEGGIRLLPSQYNNEPYFALGITWAGFFKK